MRTGESILRQKIQDILDCSASLQMFKEIEKEIQLYGIDKWKQGMSDAAEVASLFSIQKKPIHPDISFDELNESAKMIYHTTCQHVSEEILTARDNKKEI